MADDVSKVPPRTMPDPEYRLIDEWSDEDAFEVIDQNQGRRRGFDFLEIQTFEGSYNRTIYTRIIDAFFEAKERVDEFTKYRWDFRENEMHIPSLLWAHLFGVDHDPQIEVMILLLRMGGVNTHDYWIDGKSLDELNFDRVILKSGRST